LIFHLTAWGQYDCSFAHYSAKHGLSQYTVSMIYQDSRDIMWFGTFNGLNKFDGYRFKVYHTLSGLNETPADNRIDDILEDDFGVLWIVTHERRVLRFDMDREQFFPVLKAQGNTPVPPVTNVQKMSSGHVWLYTAKEGCYLVKPHVDPQEAEVVHFSLRDGSLPSNDVKEVFATAEGNEWVVTAGGIVRIDDENGPERIPDGEASESYLCGFNAGREIWCGMSGGKIRIFDTAAGRFREIDLPVASGIVDIGGLKHGKALLLTEKEGFIVYDPATRKAEVYNKRKYPAIPSDRMVRVKVDSYGEAWIETADPGMLHFDPESQEIRYFLPEVDQAGIYRYSAWSSVIEDVNGYTWVYPKGGGFSFYDRESRELRPFYNEPGDPMRRFSNVVFQFFSDRQGNLWMNTYSRGIEKVSFTRSPMYYFRPTLSANASAENEVRALTQTGDGIVWCAARDGSLYLYDAQYRRLGRLGADGRLDSSPAFNNFVYSMTEDRAGNVWLGTRNEGVFRLDRQEAGRYRIANYRHSPANALSISSDNIYAIYEDPEGRLWFGSWGGGLNCFDPSRQDSVLQKYGESREPWGLPETAEGHPVFYNYRNRLTTYPVSQFGNVRCVTGDSQGVIWVGTTTGLVQFTPLSDNDYQAVTHQCRPGDQNSPAADNIHDILVVGDTLWIATFGGGLNRMTRDMQTGEVRFTAYNTEKGFPADIILNIERDENGFLWMNSENEIIRFDPVAEKAETFTAHTPDYTGDIHFSEGSSLRDNRGNLVFGHNAGAYRFNPATISKSPFIPRMLFSQFMLFNREVKPGEDGSPLIHNIDDTRSIRLKHNQSVFSLEFAALDYNNSEAVEYAYMLDGFDQAWNYVGNQRVATYTNLSYGEYTLNVRSTNADKVWVENIRSLQIEILPPFGRTGWAYLLYGVTAVVLLYVGSRLFFSFYRLRNEVEVERRMTEMKLRFFTDISHEIRTPLTLISTPVEHLLKNGELNESERDTLSLVKTNTDRLLRLVNQLLDFRKIQHRKMKMHIEPVGLASFAASVCYSFVREAEERDIRFTFHDYSDGAQVWADKDKLEKILFNLLSNAFKFTADGRAIFCTVSDDVNEMTVTIGDEGSGIPPEILENLFVRFESTDRAWHNSTREGTRPGPDRPRPRVSGTGIGLSLTRELVNLHFGRIDVETGAGTGTKIEVRFPKGHSRYADLEGYTILGSENETNDIALEENQPENHPREHAFGERNPGEAPVVWIDEPENHPTVLFIEDNRELRQFLVLIAGSHYRILEAGSGETGLKLARTEQPDIIVSDIMMERIDGLEVISRLRADISTSHIPVILLTARSGLDERLQAMELGADDYIVKPFSSTYLLARISNLLEQRVKLQEFYASSIGLSSLPSKEESPSQMQPSSVDTGFMEKLRRYMEKNLADPDLRIEGLLAHFCISRSLLFKKIKSLTGLSPVEYIREYRIQRATELICNPDLNIKEITYRVGMSDSRYFARCFKQKHGVTPSEYRAGVRSTGNR
ncbi:MAG: response regulator, partial [Rikenellaceae bacterium]|nr:response regulator [Rikenellaceae bacterium]